MHVCVCNGETVRKDWGKALILIDIISCEHKTQPFCVITSLN